MREDARVAWAVLGFAMLCSAALILYTTHGQNFAIDEILYYGRVADKGGELVHYPPFSPEYLLAPFNGHLALGGRFVYELVFATVGAEYTVFVLVNIAALFAVVALVFELVRRRLGNLAALAPCIVLLFLGFAREQLLWPLDFNTAASLAAGLGAVLAIQREDRRGDLLACLLLLLSVAMIELGLSFAVGIAVWLAVSRRREAPRRAWVAAVPILLYAAWYVWALKFGQSEGSAANVDLIPAAFLHGAAAALGSLTGTNPIVAGAYVGPVTWFGRALAIALGVVLVVRLWGRQLPHTIWVWLLVLGSYWTLLALAARPVEGSRYILVAAVLIVLIAAEMVRRRVADGAAIALLVLALVALPANIAQLTEGRDDDALHHYPPVSSTELAMFELAREHVDPDYIATIDPRVAEVDGGIFIGIPAGAYLDAAAANGSIAYSLDEVRGKDERLRLIADASLVGALGVGLKPSTPPPGTAKCRSVEVPAGEESTSFRVAAGSTYLRPRTSDRTGLWLARFADSPRSIGIDYLPRGWSKLTIPADSAPDPWRAAVDHAVVACPGS
ncbi:MAG TPA: hypothetical protein VH703_03785 [Solirubrobacterales bacterium]